MVYLVALGVNAAFVAAFVLLPRDHVPVLVAFVALWFAAQIGLTILSTRRRR
jgi:hypothetical protein